MRKRRQDQCMNNSCNFKSNANEKKTNATLNTNQDYIEIEGLVYLRNGLAKSISIRYLRLKLLGVRFHAHLTVPEIRYAVWNKRMNHSSSNYSRCMVLLQLVSTTHRNDWPALIILLQLMFSVWILGVIHYFVSCIAEPPQAASTDKPRYYTAALKRNEGDHASERVSVSTGS